MIPGEIFPASGEIVLKTTEPRFLSPSRIQATDRFRWAVIIILLRPTQPSLSIETLLLGIAWTFRRERLCVSSRASRVKSR